MVTSSHFPGYEGYRRFKARYPGPCGGSCGRSVRVGQDVLGSKATGNWHVVCLPCAAAAGRPAVRGGPPAPPRVPASGPHRPRVTAPPPPRSEWSRLVEYLLSCVRLESFVAPVPWRDRSRWKVLPLPAETVLCGSDLALPSLAQLDDLLGGLGKMEAVFYGWPLVVVLDRYNKPHVAPLFVRQLAIPETPGPAAAGPAVADPVPVPVADTLPHVNMRLLTQEWFAPEMLADAAKVIAGETIRFGAARAVSGLATELLAALDVPATPLDPARLADASTVDEPWYPQQVGVFNLVMAFRGQLDAATHGLIGDLEWMARATDWPDSAARFLFQPAPDPAPEPSPLAVVALNDAQETALASAASAPLTVVTGPPGTGKSQVVTAIMAAAWERGESVLLASTNNTPVDDVVNDKAAEVDPALVLRTGNGDKRTALADQLRALAATAAHRPAVPGGQSLVADLLDRDAAVALLERRATAEQALLDAALRRDRGRALLWGDRPLPPSELYGRIRRSASRAAGTRWRWLRRRRTARLHELVGITDPTVPAQPVLDWVLAEQDTDHARQAVARFWQTQSVDPLDAYEHAARALRESSVATTRERVRRGLMSGVDALGRLADALPDSRRRDALADAAQHVRGWATTTLSTRSNFACGAATIDLVVIDEASQCALAHVLPLAYRARRLVIVGDPQQLTPVVTANHDVLRSLAEAAGLDHDSLTQRHLTHGQDSAFSAFAARREPILLDEHYRCHPEIIEFCNREFYDGRLTALTSVDVTGDPARGLTWYEIDGRTERDRTSGVLNRAEAEAVAAWVRDCGLPGGRIGVVTPFRAQARLISELLGRPGDGPDEIRIGTAHTFQGGERDTIVFSTVLSVGANPGTVAWVEGERNLINVAVSRARRHLAVFGNAAQLRRLGARTLVALADAARRPDDPALPSLAGSPVVTGLYGVLRTALSARGMAVVLGEQVEGYPVAIAVTTADGRRIDVEVTEFATDGDPRGRYQRQLALRDANLTRLSWQVVRVPGWRAYLEPQSVADHLTTLSHTPVTVTTDSKDD